MADTLKDIKSLAGSADNLASSISRITSATAKSSATRLTKDQVFQFPIIMDADIDNDEKYPMIKSIEKNYASLIMLAITNQGYVDRDKFPQINDFLKQFHNNDGAAVFQSLDSFNLVDAIVQEGWMTKEEMVDIWATGMEGLDDTSINDMYKPYQRTAAKLTRAIENALDQRLKTALEAGDAMFYKIPKAVFDKDNNIRKDATGNNMYETDKFVYVEASSKNAKLAKQYGAAQTLGGWHDSELTQKIADAIKEEKQVGNIQRAFTAKQNQLNREANAQNQKNQRDFQAQQAIQKHQWDLEAEERKKQEDRRKEKLNALSSISGGMMKDDKFSTLAPTMLTMTLANASKEKGNWAQQLIIGVKAMPRMISQSLMINSMVEACKDRPIFGFIKWTKGELNFVDVLFGWSEARNEVKSQARWLKVLRKRAKKNNRTRLVGAKANPNTTIIITDSDVHLIFEQCGVDLNNPGNVQKLMDKYFLLGFGIYDTEGKMLRIMYDGESDFTYQSLRSMIADSKKDQNLLAMGRY